MSVTKEGSKVAIKLNIDPLASLEKAGIDCSIIRDAVKSYNLKVVTTLTSVKVVTPEGDVITSIKINPDALVKLDAPEYKAVLVPQLKDVVAIASAQVANYLGKAIAGISDAELTATMKTKLFKPGDKVIWNEKVLPPVGAILVANKVYTVTAKPHPPSAAHLVGIEPGGGKNNCWWADESLLLPAPTKTAFHLLAKGPQDSIEKEQAPVPSAGSPAMSLLTPKGPGLSAQASKTPTTSYPVFKSGDLGMPCIKLRDAIGLYRPVKGTDDDSRYFLVADFGDLKMAARWKGATLSIRFETPNMPKYKTTLSDLGMSTKSDYASTHMSGVDSAMTCNKVIGAMIYGSGCDAISPKPDLALIHNKGH
jgi:hypothetical protein